MKKNSVELIDEKEQLKKRALEIINQCKKEEFRSMSDEEKEEFEKIKTQIENINSELEKIKKSLEDEEKALEDEDKTENKNLTKKTNMKKETRNFSLLNAIRDIANNRTLDDAAKTVAEAGAKEMRDGGLSFTGALQIPTEQRAITVGGEGEDLVETVIGDILEPLRAKNVLVNAGAKFITNLVGDVQIPIMTATNVNWADEVAEAEDAGGEFTNVKMTPKRLTAVLPISKQFLVQTSPAAEAMLRSDLVNAISAKIEETVLGAEDKTADKPAGIFYNGGLELTKITDFKGLCDLEAGIEDANVIGECKYLLSNKAKAALRNMAKSTKSTQLVYENGTIDGTPALNTSHIKNNAIAYGDFSNLAIGQWGGIDLTVDNYTLASKGQIRLVVNFFVDAAVLRPEAIKVATL